MKIDIILLLCIFEVSLSTVINSAVEGRSEYSEVTDVRAERIVYEWKIKNFHLLPQMKNETLYSQWFYSGNRTEQWRLVLYPRGYAGSDIDDVSVYLARGSPGKSEIKITYEMKIFKYNEIIRNKTGMYTYTPFAISGWTHFVKRSEILDKNLSHSSGHNDITLQCIIYLPSETVSSEFDSTIFESQNTTLIDDFRLRLKDPAYSDFTVIVGDTKFPTHKVVLATRSPIFTAMFNLNSTDDSHKAELRIKDMEPAVVNGMLEFIYTDQVTDMKDLVKGLMELAYRYELEGLKIKCMKTLFEDLNYENAAEILQLADHYHADTLKKCVIRYIVGHAHEVVESEGFKRMELNTELLRELIQNMAH